MQIYIIRNTINGKFYIGATTQALFKRLRNHIDRARVSSRKGEWVSPLGMDILLFGHKAFTIESLQTCKTRKQMDKSEAFWIKELDALGERGYNIKQGGTNAPLPASTRKKIKEREITEETKQKLRDSWRKRHVTPQQLAALDRGRENRTFEAMSVATTGSRNPRAKLNDEQVSVIKRRLLNGESQSALGREYGVNQTTIGFIARGVHWDHIEPAPGG